MAVEENIHESKNLSVKRESKRDIYISYNSLSQQGEVKSVSQSMHNYIKEGFDRISRKSAEGSKNTGSSDAQKITGS